MAKQRPRARTHSRVASEAESMPLFASVMRQLKPDSVQVEGRPKSISTGLPSIDRALRGGLVVGGATLVAARLRAGATSFLIGAALAAMKRGQRVAYFTERLRQQQVRGRFVVLESRVNGHRFAAGFATAEDRIALAAGRERIPWSLLSGRARKKIPVADIDAHVFSYRPLLVVADVRPRSPIEIRNDRLASLLDGIERLCSVARKHRIALLVRLILPKGAHRPDILELPGVGRAADPFDAVVLLHRGSITADDAEGGADAEARIVRVAGHEVEPRLVPLRFDQRFAGLLER